MRAPEKKKVGGVAISATSYTEACRHTANLITSLRASKTSGDRPTSRYVTVTSVHGVVTAQNNEKVREILNGAEMATPDGMPIVWALRSFGIKGQQRVYGPTLTLHLCEQAAHLGHRIFLYGGREDTLDELIRNLNEKFPRLQIVDAYSPPFRPLTDEEDRMVVDRITESEADIVFVGISTPKQELWMADHVDKLPGVVMFGVGAAFDFHAGRVKQAPPWIQRNGLEWFFRLVAEPKRLWRRYVLETPRFLPLWAGQWFSESFFSARPAAVGGERK